MSSKFIAVAFAVFAFASCGGGDEKTTSTDTAKTAEMSMPQHQENTASKKEMFANVKFDLAKDPACNMPISAGIEDTTHYKDKVYGFCSKECKDEFLKDPESFLAKK